MVTLINFRVYLTGCFIFEGYYLYSGRNEIRLSITPGSVFFLRFSLLAQVLSYHQKIVIIPSSYQGFALQARLWGDVA